MAGMLPGVEAARIRRFHKSNLNGGGSTRRSSFCLYATHHQEFHISSSSSMPVAGFEDEKLEEAVREAKKRLDHRFQSHWKTGNHKSKGKRKDEKDPPSLQADSQR